jgi:DNA repair protein RecN (Recombination protein N)
VLRELLVQNLALIEDARIELKPGYCAWTGETGAGKSLLLTALGLVLGEKASARLVREGRDEARAEAVFDLRDPTLRADLEGLIGHPISGNALTLSRRVNRSGRSTAQANGLPVPIVTLRALGERLIDIHGQHSSRALLDPGRQRDLLDEFGRIAPRLARYQARRDAHEQLRQRRLRLLKDVARRENERQLLVFERDELAAAQPKPGEYAELTREAQRLASAEQVRQAALEGFSLLYESERSAQEILERVARVLAPLADCVPEFAGAAADLARLADETREVAYALRSHGQRWEDDPDRLEEVEARLALYRKLASRFRRDPDALADRLEAVETELAELESQSADLQALEGPLAEAWGQVLSASAELTAARTRAAKSFGKAVQSQLKGLGLDHARVSVELTSRPLEEDPSATIPSGGVDSVEFTFTGNPGEPARPLRKVASGGELSRVMLAVKSALAEAHPIPTLVFDEIDTGVGGRLGAALGRKLAELARHYQVICVTHLPQMASFASHQWIIRKQSARGRTRTTIAPLGEAERVDELAAMLRGESAAEGTRQEALAMLLEARTSL